MDIYKAIGTLKEELKRLDRAIASLEHRDGEPARPRRRAWNGSARKAAAERMRKYWEARRGVAQAAGAGHQSVSPPSTDIA
jgi:hypothetical protein